MCMSLIRNHCHHLVVAHDIIRIITQDQSTTPPEPIRALGLFAENTQATPGEMVLPGNPDERSRTIV